MIFARAHNFLIIQKDFADLGRQLQPKGHTLRQDELARLSSLVLLLQITRLLQLQVQVVGQRPGLGIGREEFHKARQIIQPLVFRRAGRGIG